MTRRRGLCEGWRACRAGGSAVLGLALMMSLGVNSARSDAACQPETRGWTLMQEREIVLMAAGKREKLSVRLADNRTTRAAGYQWICPEQAAATAVLFAFSGETQAAFHMRNVFTPLVIAFFSEAGERVDVLTMQPEPPGHAGSRRFYRARAPFRYALEIPTDNPKSAWLSASALRLLSGSDTHAE